MQHTSRLIRITPEGPYCEPGGFHIDPWRPVRRAVITHAHGDHARPGSELYLVAREGAGVLRLRMQDDARIDTVAYGETVDVRGVRLSLHPAGHILGSAQVRLEHRGEVCVVSGDYKVAPDATCAPFEPLRCHTFVTESTFGLPIYDWPDQQAVFGEINRWWRTNREAGRNCILFAYSLGKAQRVVSGLDPDIGPILCHGAVERMNTAYRAAGVHLPPTRYAGAAEAKAERGAMIIAPPSAGGTAWMRKFGTVETAFASGWMAIRGARRRRAVDRGFVLSDHADWRGLQQAVRETGAENVLVTHGQVGPMVRWLREQGLQSEALATQYIGERDDVEVDAAETDQEELAPPEARP
jgi:putative mRNA 3-end processing factor